MQNKINEEIFEEYLFTLSIPHFDDLLFPISLEESLNCHLPYPYSLQDGYQPPQSKTIPKDETPQIKYPPPIQQKPQEPIIDPQTCFNQKRKDVAVEIKNQCCNTLLPHKPINKPMKARDKSNKNQYDKNIFGNICKTILKQITNGEYQKQLTKYCLHFQVNYNNFLATFTKIDIDGIRMGTTQFTRLLENPGLSSGIKKVFSVFFVRFLRDDYLLHIIGQGRMKDKLKYVRCATKMMYIPRLDQEDYELISRRNQLGRDI